MQELSDLPHLHPAAQQVARLPGAERLRHVRADRWIGYTRATEALARLETLLAPGDAGTNDLSRWDHWSGPWQPRRPVDRICPVCAADPDRGAALVWRLPLMVGCVEHRCRLEDTRLARPAIALNTLDRPRSTDRPRPWTATPTRR